MPADHVSAPVHVAHDAPPAVSIGFHPKVERVDTAGAGPCCMLAAHTVGYPWRTLADPHIDQMGGEMGLRTTLLGYVRSSPTGGAMTTQISATGAPPARPGMRPAERSPGIVAPGLLLGVGLGGFVDGIVLHQLLQWHHMLTDYGDASYPATSVSTLEDNTFWDGLFHAATWLFVLGGLLLLWRAVHRGARTAPLALTGLLLAGWGIFNVVEGILSHHVLTIHHVRDDVADPLWWDLGFLASGLVLIAAGYFVHRRATQNETEAARPAPGAAHRGII